MLEIVISLVVAVARNSCKVATRVGTSEDFNAWRSWSRHENLEQNNRFCIQSRIQASIDLSPRVSNITVTPANLLPWILLVSLALLSV